MKVICPKCKRVYKTSALEAVTECEDCHVPLATYNPTVANNAKKTQTYNFNHSSIVFAVTTIVLGIATFVGGAVAGIMLNSLLIMLAVWVSGGLLALLYLGIFYHLKNQEQIIKLLQNK